jgi:hypothetical protein
VIEAHRFNQVVQELKSYNSAKSNKEGDKLIEFMVTSRMARINIDPTNRVPARGARNKIVDPDIGHSQWGKGKAVWQAPCRASPQLELGRQVRRVFVFSVPSIVEGSDIPTALSATAKALEGYDDRLVDVESQRFEKGERLAPPAHPKAPPNEICNENVRRRNKKKCTRRPGNPTPIR